MKAKPRRALLNLSLARKIILNNIQKAQKIILNNIQKGVIQHEYSGLRKILTYAHCWPALIAPNMGLLLCGRITLRVSL